MRKLLLAVLVSSLSFNMAAADTKGVVMDFGALDTIDALGAGNTVVALPVKNAPEYLSQYTTDQYQSTGGMKEPNIELIREIKPDYIITSGRQGQFVEELKTIAPVTQFLSTEEKIGSETYLDGVKNNIVNVGKVVGKESEAEVAWGKLDAKIKDAFAKNSASPKKAVVVLHNNGNLGISNNSNYAKTVHEVAGVKRADEKTYEGRMPADAKYFAETNPDVIFVVDRSAAIGAEPMVADFFSAGEYADIQEIKDAKVVVLTPKLWYLSGHGLQSLELQVDEVTKALD